MEKKQPKSFLEGDLKGLLQYGRPSSYRREEIEKSFAGEPSREFRVPAVDTGDEIFFNNREMLARFTALCKPDQEAFILAVRAAMEKEAVEEIRLKVKWSSNKERVITIQKINAGSYLNIYV